MATLVDRYGRAESAGRDAPNERIRPLDNDELAAVAGGGIVYEVTFPCGCTVRYDNFPGTLSQAEDAAIADHAFAPNCPNT